MNLPPLPEPRTLSRGDEDGPIQLGYTASQMRAYAAEAVRVALEEAARVADEIASFSAYGCLYQQTPQGLALRDKHELQRAQVPGAKACAAAIRALIPKD